MRNNELEDAVSLLKLGADMLGFLVVEKNRPQKVSKERARDIITRLTPDCFSIVVTIFTDPDKITELSEHIQPKALQFHSNITKENLRILKERLSQKIIKVIFVEDESAIQEAKDFEEFADYIMLDHKPGERSPLDWNICRKIVEACSKPVILEGGLKVENVREAISMVRPYGVGVLSGVETVPGKKDIEKAKEFLKVVKSFE